MQSSSDQDLRNYCKKIEDEMNRYLFSQTNSLLFINRAGSAIDVHVNHLLAVRDQTEQWLYCIGRPTKKDISVIAKKVIECEDRLDRFDDTLHQILMNIKEHRRKMEVLSIELAEWSPPFSGNGITKT